MAVLPALLSCAPGLLLRPTVPAVVNLADHPALDPPTGAPVIPEDYLGVCLDTSVVVGGFWWDGSQESQGGLGAKKIQPLDLAEPKLAKSLAALAPCLLRVGGTEADKLWYLGEPSENARKFSPYLLTSARWKEVLDLAGRTGTRLLFTLNAGLANRDSSGAWQAANARQLLTDPASLSGAVWGWELGNEPNGYGLIHGWDWQVDGARLAADYESFYRLVKEIQPEWQVAGPATAFWPLAGDFGGLTASFLHYLKTPPDLLTWHYYPQQSLRAPLATRPAGAGQLLVPEHLDEVKTGLQNIRQAVQKFPGIQLALGETGHAQFGGQPGLSDTFVSSLWWLDQAALLAAEGLRFQLRQSLWGGDYALLDPQFNPRPDYWMTLVFKRLFQGRIWPLALSEKKLRAYACRTGSATRLLLINLDQSRTFRLLPGQEFQTWLCSADPPQSGRVQLNGRSLEDLDLFQQGKVFPPGQPAHGLEVPPLTILFAELVQPGHD